MNPFSPLQAKCMQVPSSCLNMEIDSFNDDWYLKKKKKKVQIGFRWYCWIAANGGESNAEFTLHSASWLAFIPSKKIMTFFPIHISHKPPHAGPPSPCPLFSRISFFFIPINVTVILQLHPIATYLLASLHEMICMDGLPDSTIHGGDYRSLRRQFVWI